MSTFPAIQNVDTGAYDITNMNNITFKTTVPSPIALGSTINNVNNISFSLPNSAVGYSSISGVNSLSFGVVPNGLALTSTVDTLTLNGRLRTNQLVNNNAVYTSNGPAGGGPNATYMVVNGSACPGAWSLFPCTESVNFQGNRLNNVDAIDFAVQAGVGPFNLLSINANGNLTSEWRRTSAYCPMVYPERYPSRQHE
jgi:hypothetical protein